MYDSDLEQFDSIKPSYISFHDTEDMCCRWARFRILATCNGNTTEARLASVPSIFAWGPTAWPVYWCELERQQVWKGDCGVNAAICREILYRDGIAVEDAQVAIRDFGFSMTHWARDWRDSGASSLWIGSNIVYHEVLYVDHRYWDPSESRWFEGVGSQLSCGVVVATKRVKEGLWKR